MIPLAGPHRTRAFTLVEIMVAIGIFSMVMVAIYSSWHMIVSGRDSGLRAAADAQRSRMSLRVVESALFGMRLSLANAHHHAFIADTSDPRYAYLSFVSHLPASFPGSGLFGDQRLRRVTFQIEEDRFGAKNLVLLQAPMLQPLDEVGLDPIPIVLARNVDTFAVEFWDKINQEWVEEWIHTNDLPQQVNVALAVHTERDARKIQNADMRTVSIPSMAIPPEWQMPAALARGRGNANRPGNAPGNNAPGNPGGTPAPGQPLPPAGGNPSTEIRPH